MTEPRFYLIATLILLMGFAVLVYIWLEPARRRRALREQRKREAVLEGLRAHRVRVLEPTS